MKNHISFRLRKELDADLINLDINEEELPDLCRNGLRLILGIRTAPQIEISERPLQIPPADFRQPTLQRHQQPQPLVDTLLQQKQKTVSPSRPTVFTKQNHR